MQLELPWRCLLWHFSWLLGCLFWKQSAETWECVDIWGVVWMSSACHYYHNYAITVVYYTSTTCTMSGYLDRSDNVVWLVCMCVCVCVGGGGSPLLRREASVRLGFHDKTSYIMLCECLIALKLLFNYMYSNHDQLSNYLIIFTANTWIERLDVRIRMKPYTQ